MAAFTLAGTSAGSDRGTGGARVAHETIARRAIGPPRFSMIVSTSWARTEHPSAA
jgi:hypothetical protein